MEVKRKIVKDLKIALKDMKPGVQQLQPLLTGRDLNNFSLRPREVWANWLLCAVLQHVQGTDITFGEDEQGDGIFLDKKTGQWVMTEHVSALDNASSTQPLPSGEARIIEAIDSKIKKGPDYAKNKYLIVFFDGAGSWRRDKVREAINGRHNFMLVFLIGLLTSGKEGYAYSVTELHENSSITFKVHINSSFTDWEIERL